MKTLLQRALSGMALAFLSVTLPAAQEPPALTVRPPMLINGITASRDQIVFTFAGDLWRVGRAGGEARRIAELPGEEESPAFSPDGSWLAFSRSNGGGSDIWVMPAAAPSALSGSPGWRMAGSRGNPT